MLKYRLYWNWLRNCTRSTFTLLQDQKLTPTKYQKWVDSCLLTKHESRCHSGVTSAGLRLQETTSSLMFCCGKVLRGDSLLPGERLPSASHRRVLNSWEPPLKATSWVWFKRSNRPPSRSFIALTRWLWLCWPSMAVPAFSCVWLNWCQLVYETSPLCRPCFFIFILRNYTLTPHVVTRWLWTAAVIAAGSQPRFCNVGVFSCFVYTPSFTILYSIHWLLNCYCLFV